MIQNQQNQQNSQSEMGSSSNSKQQYLDQSSFVLGKDADEQVITQSIKNSLHFVAARQHFNKESKNFQIESSTDKPLQQNLLVSQNASFNTILSNLSKMQNMSYIHQDAHLNAVWDQVTVLKDRSIRRKAEIIRLAGLLKDNGIKFQLNPDLSISSDNLLNSLNQSNKVNFYKTKYQQYKKKCQKYQQKLQKLKNIAK